jgi:hypothetical protein
MVRMLTSHTHVTHFACNFPMITQGPAAAWLLQSQTHLAERDLDGLQAFSLDVVRRVQQKMEKEKCCFCLARKEDDRNLCKSMQE